MSVLHFCEWLQGTPASTAIRESVWMFPFLDTFHVLSLGLFLGSITIFDLRLLGVGLKREPVSEVGKRLLPWTWYGFAAMALSGALVFWSEPVKCYHSTAFRLKITLMILAGLNALTFHMTVYRGVAAWDRATLTPARARLAGFLSLVLWAGVVASGRFVGYRF
jgi:Family of unknown function (DUF6644)